MIRPICLAIITLSLSACGVDNDDAPESSPQLAEEVTTNGLESTIGVESTGQFDPSSTINTATQREGANAEPPGAGVGAEIEGRAPELPDRTEKKLAAELEPDSTETLENPAEQFVDGAEYDLAIEQQKTDPARLDENSLLELSFDRLMTLLSLSVALLSTCIAFYLYRWRAWLTKSGPVLVPERVGSELDKFNHGLKTFGLENKNSLSELTLFIQRLVDRTAELEKNINEMTEVSMTLQGKIAGKDAEITRLKEGYDQAIYSKFLRKFIKINGDLRSIDPGAENISKSINNLQVRLEEALEDCGVKEQFVDIGANYLALGDLVSDNPDVEATDDPSLDNLVKSVVMPAYVVGEGESRKVIAPAKVVIHRSEEN